MLKPAPSTATSPVVRPPTPPRESERRISKTLPSALERKHPNENISQRAFISSLTPPNSGASPNNTTESKRKKVGWAESADYSEPLSLSFDPSGGSPSIQALPPSAERKASRSILKTYNGAKESEYSIGNISKLLPPHQHPNFATMLESIVQQLAGSDRNSKIDAYVMLSSAIKASENVPDPRALKSKMSLLCQFMCQDITSLAEKGKAGSSLTINALLLLASFLQRKAIAETLPSEFQVTILEYIIKSFRDSSTSKELTRHLLFILGNMNFSSRTLNQERASKLIDALHNLESQVKGKSIVSGRIQAYRNLLRKARACMLVNTDWIDDLFIDMRSSNRDIRSSSLEFAIEASFEVGAEASISRTVVALFDMEHSDGLGFAEYYAASLKTMVKKKDDGAAVAQIWSVIMLFIRAKPRLFEQWKHMKLFLEVIEACWNSSDSSIRHQANSAWNRFIWAVKPTEYTPPNVRSMLLQPLLVQIRARKSPSTRFSALNSVYHLLYYALALNSTVARLDMYWDEYVIPLLVDGLLKGFERSPEMAMSDNYESCAILRSLFDRSIVRPWSENRSIEKSTRQNMMLVNELPALDAKWLRSKVAKVHPILWSLMEILFWDLGIEDSPISKLWQAYVRAIAFPAQMEIKVSNDTMRCIGSVFGFLHKTWTGGRQAIFNLPQSKGPHGSNTTASFLTSFEKIILTMIDALGPLAFTEKLLSISQNNFVAIVTPSHTPKAIRLEIKYPLHHLILFLMTPSPQLEYDYRFSNMVRGILLPFFEARKSGRAKREFVKEIFNLLPVENSVPCGLIWQALAELAATATDIRDAPENDKQTVETLGSEYREIIKILVAGMRYSPCQPMRGWQLLFDALVVSATLDAGDAGNALAVIEPLTRSLPGKNGGPMGLHYLHAIATKVSFPKDQQALNAARKKLWGTSNPTQKIYASDPYLALYEGVRFYMERAYQLYTTASNPIYVDIIDDISALLSNCPEALLLGSLIRIQHGIAPWFQDLGLRLTDGKDPPQSGEDPELRIAVHNLCTVVWVSITKILRYQTHTQVLKDLEVLVCSGLESRHKTIVSSTLTAWNSTFGSCQDHLEYPDRAKSALRRLYPVADVLLPFFPANSLDSTASLLEAQRITFVESQKPANINLGGESSSGSLLKPRSSLSIEDQVSLITRRRPLTMPPQVGTTTVPLSLTKRTREATPDSRATKLRKKDTTPKLRHDDSQIEFEAVPSSPIADRIADSQLLTTKQKDTRERQNAEAHMFRDLRSSPQTGTLGNTEPADELELPAHGSQSRLRSKAFQHPRQTTPTLELPSDDNQFIPSSPTPTRPTNVVLDNLDPPSSPPESAVKHKVNVNQHNLLPSREHTPNGKSNAETPCGSLLDANDELSSHVEPEGEFFVNKDFEIEDPQERSLDPSAQVDPYNLPVSNTSVVWESTDENLIDEPSQQLLVDASQHPVEDIDLRTLEIHPTADTAEDLVAESMKQETAQEELFDRSDDEVRPQAKKTIEVEQIARPSTPTSHFFDAPTSPALSESHEEVFEDAVSSPGKRTERLSRMSPSSPSSEFDETSLLRIVAEYDQGTNHPGTPISFAQKFETKPRNPAADLPLAVPLTQRNSKLKENPNAEVQMNKQDKDTEADISGEPKTSSIPSLVPETPAPAGEKALRYYDYLGNEIDLTQTIIVDSSRIDQDTNISSKRNTSKSPRKKRKYWDIIDDDASEVSGQGTPGSGKRSQSQSESPAKKRRGRSARTSSQLSNELSGQRQGSFGVESQASSSQVDLEMYDGWQSQHDQSIISVEIDATKTWVAADDAKANSLPIPEPEPEPKTPANADADATDVSRTEGDVAEQPDDMRENNEQTKASLPTDDDDAALPDTQELSEPSAMDIIEETRYEDTFVEEPIEEAMHRDAAISEGKRVEVGSNIVEALGPVVTKPESYLVEEVVLEISDVPAEIATSEGSTSGGVLNTVEPVRSQPGVGSWLFESVKKRLLSVVGDLNLLGLGRREVSELEDIFMDGKKALYQAESRGRGRGL